MRCSILLCVVLGLCVFTVTAAPTVAASGASTMDVPNDIVKKFKEGVDTWAPKLKSFANTIFLCSMTIALSYVALSAAVIILGIGGGGGIFKDYAVNTMRYALAVTFKLFVMSLLMGLGMQFLDTLKANAAFEFPQFCVLVAVSIILLGLVKSIPDVCAGIIQGSHIGSGASLGSAIRTVASAGMTGMGAAWTLAKAPVTVPKAALRMGRNIRDAANLAGMKGKGGILGTIGELSNAQNEARMGKGQFRFGEQAGQNLQGKLADMRMRAGDGSSNTGGA